MESQGTKLWFSFNERVNLNFITKMAKRHDKKAQCIVVGDESVWHDRKWMTCFVNEKVVEKVMSDKLLCSCTIHKVPPGSSVKVPPDVDWDPDEIIIYPGNTVRIMNLEDLRPLKGDSVASACNTKFESPESTADATASACDTVSELQAQSTGTKLKKREHEGLPNQCRKSLKSKKRWNPTK